MSEQHDHWFGSYVAGALGGAAGIVVGHPFDTVKVQMQTHKGEMTTTGTMAYIRDQGWARGYFRGMSFPLLSYAAINSVFFGVYDFMLRALHFDGPLQHFHLSVFLAGCIGGAAQLVVACPADVIKVVLQSQIPDAKAGRALSAHVMSEYYNPCLQVEKGQKALSRYYSGPRECVQHIIRNQGLPGLYKGLGSMAARDVPGYGIYLVVFEFLEQTMFHHNLTDQHGIFSNIIAGGIAGTASWASIFPIDVVKSRIQADEDGKYKGLWDCAVKSYKEEGPRVFFRGFVICSLRGFPSAAVTFLVYAQTMKFYNRLSDASKS